VLVLNGDVPLLRSATIESLLATHQAHRNAATILTAQLPDPKGYGRVFCDQNLIVQEIVEDRDCTDQQRQNRRINAGIYCFHWPALAAILPHLKNDNSQGEYYLTDAIRDLQPVMAIDVDDPEEIWGFNDRLQLAAACTVLQRRTKEHWLRSGVTLVDPSSITIDETVTIGPDVTIEPQTHLRGQTTIGAGARIGPGSLIENATIGEGSTVLYSVVVDSAIGPQNQVGPFAHVRGHAETGADCRLGNFVELKKAQLGNGTKVSHLSYLGDATLGNQVNVGAGTITANYDGVNKHRTTIGDRTKTGANSVLVAPIAIGCDVTIAAGSTITDDVPDDTLAIGRARQTTKPGWRLGSGAASVETTPAAQATETTP
jgi:bifunctional UDP-N-acetylglucosamine pyrophosphorylase/glucosamine-1-phosphate N-acetyltransferase